MGKKKRELRRRATDCSPSLCGMQEKVDGALEVFKSIAEKLTENQTQLRISVAKLTESVEGIHRLDDRVDKLEDIVRKNSALMYKIVGIGMAGAILLPSLLKHVTFTIG